MSIVYFPSHCLWFVLHCCLRNLTSQSTFGPQEEMNANPAAQHATADTNRTMLPQERHSCHRLFLKFSSFRRCFLPPHPFLQLPRPIIADLLKLPKFLISHQGRFLEGLALTSWQELASEFKSFKDSHLGTPTFACVLGTRGGRNHTCSAADCWIAPHFWELSGAVFAESSHLPVLSTPSSVS